MGFNKGLIRRGEFIDTPKILYLAMAFFNLSTKAYKSKASLAVLGLKVEDNPQCLTEPSEPVILISETYRGTSQPFHIFTSPTTVTSSRYLHTVFAVFIVLGPFIAKSLGNPYRVRQGVHIRP